MIVATTSAQGPIATAAPHVGTLAGAGRPGRRRARVRSLRARPTSAGRRVHFGILGPLEIRDDDGTAVAWRGAKRRGLVALLLVHRGSALTVDRIVEELWDEPTAGAAHTVQTYLSQLRRALPDEGTTLVRHGNGYALPVTDDALDAARFERLVRDAQHTMDAETCARTLRAALALWRGDALEEFVGAQWADAAARPLEALRVQAHERCVQSELDLGLGAELVAELERLTARYPLHEHFWGALMVALYRAGRQADALATCRALRTQLVESLGIAPGASIVELEQRILDQDRSLHAPRPAGHAGGPLQRELDRARPAPLVAPGERADVELREPSLTVGRLAELGRLEALLATARAGQPGVALVRGDIGIGKTRLVCDLIDRVAARATVHVVACDPYAHQSFLAVASLLDDGRVGAQGQHATAEDDAVRAGIEQFRRIAEGPGIADDAEWQTLRSRVFAALRARLARPDATGLTVLVVEDVHWADAATLEFLDDLGNELASRRTPLHLAVVVTRRAFGADEEVDAVTARLERLACTVSVRLRPLHEMDVHQLVRENGIQQPARSLVRMLHERSRGNPLYVTEALRRIQHLDAFVTRAGAIDTRITAAELGPPADLQALVEQRVAELDDDLAEVLGVAALAGETIDTALLASVCRDHAVARLAEVAGSGLVEATPHGYRFVHQLVVAALRERLTDERRRALHRAIADALRVRRDDGAEVTTALGHHVVEGGLHDLPPSAIRELWYAGRLATQVAEWGEAARMFEGAIEVATEHGVDERLIAWMRYWSGRCLEHDYDVERALVRYREAASWGRENGDIALWGLAALAAGTRVAIGSTDVFDAALDVSDFTSVLPHIDDAHTELRCRIVRKYAEVQLQLARFDDGCALANDALDLAREVGDAALVAECASTLAYGQLAMGCATPALTLLREVDRRALDGRPESEGFALARLAIAALMVGDLDTADWATAEAGAVFDAVRHRTGATLSETLAANLALLHGDLDGAEQRGERAHELFLVSQYFLALPILFGVLAETRAVRGDDRGAAEAVRAWEATGQRGSDLVELMLLARAGADDLAGRAERDEGLLGIVSAPSVMSPSMSAIAAEVAYASANAPLARRVLRNVERFPDSNVVLGAGFPYLFAHTRGLLLEADGRADDAMTAYRDALDAAESVGVPLEVARARVALARLLADEQPKEAARHVDAARAISDRHGFVAVARNARAALAAG
jgi:DNA-binding SARP family transcriptional activator